jgi:ribosomal protein S6
MNENIDNERLVYEIGYHLLPTVDESSLQTESDQIRSLITGKDGVVISEEAPKMITLAYDITKSVNTKRQSYNRAYFGWIKFEAEPSSIVEIKTKVDGMSNILRFMIIKTVKADTMRPHKVSSFKKDSPKDEGEEVKEESKEVSEEEIDKSIDELLVEDKNE